MESDGGGCSRRACGAWHSEINFISSRVTFFEYAPRFKPPRAEKRGTPEGAYRIDAKIERVIAEQIECFWLRKEKPKFSALMGQIREICLAEGLKVPHRKTVQRRVADLIPIAVARRRGEREIEAAATPSPGQFLVHRPNAIWQIDHTIVDVIVVDEELRRPIGRPVLTIAIDLFTRMVAGFHLSLEAPSSVSVGLCLLHAVYDKSAWLNEREIDIPWPVAGLPEILHCDDGAEFRSRALASACREFPGTSFNSDRLRPASSAGTIERLIGTMMGAVHVLSGTTFCNVKIRGDYDAEGRATFKLRELEKWIGMRDGRKIFISKSIHTAASSIGGLARAAGRGQFRSSAGQNGLLDKLLTCGATASPEGRHSSGKDSILV